MSYDVTINFDGACSYNCGPEHPKWGETVAAWGFVAYGKGGMPVAEHAGTLAPASSNMAELHGCLESLRWAASTGYRIVRLRGDSAFVIRFLQGHNRISRLPHIAPLQFQIARLVAATSVRSVDGSHRLQLSTAWNGALVIQPQHVGRAKNVYADRLCGDALSAYPSMSSLRPPLRSSSRAVGSATSGRSS